MVPFDLEFDAAAGFDDDSGEGLVGREDAAAGPVDGQVRAAEGRDGRYQQLDLVEGPAGGCRSMR